MAARAPASSSREVCTITGKRPRIISRPQAPEHLDAVEVGHREVEDHRDREALGDRRQRRLAAGGLAHLPGALAQVHAHHVARRLVVVDDQHRAGRALRAPRASAALAPKRQAHGERRPTARLAGRPPACRREARRACARAAGRARCRCACSGPGTWTNSSKMRARSSSAIPMPVSITRRHEPVAAALGVHGHAALGGELDRVADQVAQDLDELALVGAQRGQVRARRSGAARARAPRPAAAAARAGARTARASRSGGARGPPGPPRSWRCRAGRRPA